QDVPLPQRPRLVRRPPAVLGAPRLRSTADLGAGCGLRRGHVSDESPGLAAWLATADNRETWTRLRDGLALADGFELLFGVVADPQAGAWLSELLEARARELGRRFVQL